MSSLPEDYLHRVYAGVLGKLVGVYLGRPFENWTYQEIQERLGDIDYYVHDKLGVPLVVIDDDVSGTFAFVRALEEHGVRPDLSSEEIGKTWLNQVIERRSIFWWGGNGISTEHTTFLNLKKGIPAPLSGAASTNGLTMAEQIGAQIFIDGWAMVAPGNPALASQLAEAAARVSHDGEAVYAAKLWAAMEAEAFITKDVDHLLEVGLKVIPAESLIAKMIADVRSWAKQDGDWKQTRQRIEDNYGYDKYLGICHVIPNHAIMIMSLLYGGHDFHKAMHIINTCGWDTDCNSGNVACLVALMHGLAGFEGGPDWLGPLADRAIISSADNGYSINNATRIAYDIANLGRRLSGHAEIQPPKDGAQFHFSLPGSVQGFQATTHPNLVHVSQGQDHGIDSLDIQIKGLADSNDPVEVITETFTPLDILQVNRNYEMMASPLVYPGQLLKAELGAADSNTAGSVVCLRIKAYNEQDDLVTVDSSPIFLEPGKQVVLEWTIPDSLQNWPIQQIGLAIATTKGPPALDGAVFLHSLRWDGAPRICLKRPTSNSQSFWRRAWVSSVDKMHTDMGPSFFIAQDRGEGILSQGTRDWVDYKTVVSNFVVNLGGPMGVAARVQGLNRYYALMFTKDNQISLVKAKDEKRIELASKDFDWKNDVKYDVHLTVRGSNIEGQVGDVTLTAVDGDYAGGASAWIEAFTSTPHHPNWERQSYPGRQQLTILNILTTAINHPGSSITEAVLSAVVARGRSECIFPKSRRAPVRQKRATRSRDEELLKSLRRLERRLQSTEMPGSTQAHGPLVVDDNRLEEPAPLNETVVSNEVAVKKEEPARLVLDQDRSRYISNNFWASMSREIEEMRDILDGSSSSEEEDHHDHDQEQERDTPSSRLSQNSGGLFIFSPTVSPQTLQSLYPSSSDLLTIFDVFQENVDPVARIFHCPTLRTTVAEALPLLDRSLDRHTEVILFSISYAALTSLNEPDCQRLFGEERRVMLPRYRHAVEQSLARARFLDSQNLVVLASLVLFLICVRRHDSSRFVSSLLGVVIRNAQAMGLHRDGTNFQLSPYETEMRRRIWWHICVLDIRASEDHGCDPSIYDQTYDTRFPLNINDEDISPQNTLAPPERSAGSDMIFCLLRFEVAVALRKLNYPAPVGSREPELSVSQKRRMVEAIEKRFHERYISRCDITKPFDWVSATWARLMLAKMWLATSNPLQLQDDSDSNMPSDLRNLAFEKSVEVLELSDVLETGHRAARWRWLFLTHVQWHAVVCVLAHLCILPTNELAHRAWLVIDRVCERWPSYTGSKKGMLWKPIRRLMVRAQQTRVFSEPSSRNKAGQNYSRVPEISALHSTPQALAPQPVIAHKTSESAADQAEDGADILSVSHSNTSWTLSGPISRQHDHRSQDFSPDLIDNTTLESTFDRLDPHGMDDFLNPQSLRSDWSDILHELQLGFQEGGDVAITDPADAMQGYGMNFWDTL
ncbi:hypothetical protein FDECE_490 [Fusarium decemcellulare]|nr:hypothetical protein FDECE_490 [Fusarium decemcellulare]